jgi:hypothetical protein
MRGVLPGSGDSVPAVVEPPRGSNEQHAAIRALAAADLPERTVADSSLSLHSDRSSSQRQRLRSVGPSAMSLTAMSDPSW